MGGPAHLAIAVLDDHEHWRVLALHCTIQGLYAHAVLGCAKRQRPRVADGPGREILSKLEIKEHDKQSSHAKCHNGHSTTGAILGQTLCSVYMVKYD